MIKNHLLLSLNNLNMLHINQILENSQIQVMEFKIFQEKLQLKNKVKTKLSTRYL